MSASASPTRWRLPALLLLWLDVAVTFALTTLSLWDSRFTADAWIQALQILLTGLVLAWWTTIFGRVTLGLRVPTTDGTLRALAASYPLLTALNLVIWGFSLLVVLDGTFPTANPVALTALMSVWGASILASNAVNAGLIRLATAPDAQAQARTQRLAEWLNLSAALSLGLLVMNLMPIKGYAAPPSHVMFLAYLVGGTLDLLSTALAFLAVRERLQPGPEARQRRP